MVNDLLQTTQAHRFIFGGEEKNKNISNLQNMNYEDILDESIQSINQRVLNKRLNEYNSIMQHHRSYGVSDAGTMIKTSKFAKTPNTTKSKGSTLFPVKQSDQLNSRKASIYFSPDSLKSSPDGAKLIRPSIGESGFSMMVNRQF